jgi:hypothetical protein
LWEQKIWFLEQKNLMLWEQIYSCGNKPWLSEQKCNILVFIKLRSNVSRVCGPKFDSLIAISCMKNQRPCLCLLGYHQSS